MIKIDKKSQCCGCTACYNACPKSAINMSPDEEGFLYPKIDFDKCVNCGICNQVCPVEHKIMPSKGERKSFAIRTKNKDVLINSTSGGFITPLTTYVLENNGVVCAAAYDEKFEVKHILIENTGGGYNLSSIRGSRYVQSYLGDCFAKIKRYLDQKCQVCFIGTTCQVNGLKAYLRKDYEWLITVDLVCHGTPSPKLWDKYLDYQRNRYHSEISEISFRNKTYGYHSGTMKIRFKNGKEYFGSARVDYMLKSFFKEIASRPICYQCPFKALERCSDFTIYDCWHAAELVSGLKDDDKGYTNVIVQSEKGEKILKRIGNAYELYPVDTQQAVKLDGIMIRNSAIHHPRRFEFYTGIDERTMPEQIRKFIPVSKKDILIERTKIVFYRLGIFQVIKKVLKR